MPKKTLITIIVLAVVVGLLLILKFSPHPPSSLTTTTPANNSINDIMARATPFLVKPTGTGTEYYVGSPQSSNYTVYVGSDDKLQYSIEKNPQKFAFSSLDGYIGKYGSPNEVRYGPWAEAAGFASYVFYQPGLVVVAHPTSKAITEVWQLKPNLSSTEFNSEYSIYFYITPPPRKTQM